MDDVDVFLRARKFSEAHVRRCMRVIQNKHQMLLKLSSDLNIWQYSTKYLLCRRHFQSYKNFLRFILDTADLKNECRVG